MAELSKTKFYEDIECGPCNFRQLVTTAVVWCPVCDEGLCSSCHEHHTAAKATREHKLLDVSDYKEIGIDVTSAYVMCEVHDEKCQLYCPGHETHCCVDCVSSHHVDCTGITLLDKVVGNIKHSAGLESLLEKLERRTKRFEQLKDNRKDNIQRLTQQKDGLLEDVKNFRTEINEVLDDFEVKIKLQAHNIRRKSELALQKACKQIEGHKNVYQDMHQALQRVVRYGSNTQIYFTMKKLQRATDNEDKNVAAFLQKGEGAQEISLEFIRNQEFATLLTNQIPLGTVQSKKSIPECARNVIGQLDAQTSSSNSSLVCKVANKSYIHTSEFIKHYLNPENANISSIALLPNGKIVVTDNGSHGGICVFDEMGNVITKVFKLGRAHGVCVLNSDLFACSFPKNENIKLISVDDLSLVRTIRVNSFCTGLSEAAGNIVACVRPSSIFMINISGTIYKRIELDLKTPNVNYVHCYQNKMIVTEFESDVLICFDLDGKELWKFESTYHDIRNVCVDTHGNVFVTELNSRKVILFSPEKMGNQQEILDEKDGLAAPKAISFDKTNNHLIIADRNGQRSVIFDVFYNS